LEQQQASEFISNYESNSLVFADVSMDRYTCEFYDQFENQVEPMITDGFMDNYIFSTDPYSYDLNIVVSSSSEHFSEKKVIMIDNQDLISREQEDDQFSSRGTVMAEQEAAIDVQLFPKNQYVSDLYFKDPVATFIESYISENPKISDFFSSLIFPGEYGFLNEFLSLLLHFKHHLLISEKDEIISVLKLLGWLLWKSTFT
jgi:hypothetical protein